MIHNDMMFYIILSFFTDVAKLVCVLLSTNNSAINLKLMELGTINILLVSKKLQYSVSYAVGQKILKKSRPKSREIK